MSMNLTARTACGPIELWQTPTWVTEACTTAGDGNIPCCDKQAALRSLKVYLCWVRGSLNGVWESDDEYEAAKSLVAEHVKMVMERMKEDDLEVDMI